MTPRRLTLPAIATLDLAGHSVTVHLRRSRRARRLLLRVDAAEARVELVLPRGVSVVAGLRFVRRQSRWLSGRLAALPPRAAFADGSVIPVLGRPLTIRHRPDRLGGAWVEGEEIHVAGRAEHLPRRVADLLKTKARSVILDAARRHAASLGRAFRRLSLRDPRTQWGSCSVDGDLSLSWRLVLAPPEVLDYVVAHEVAHLVERNHGPGFWKLVLDLAGDARGPRGWLRRHGTALLRYG